MQRAIVVVTIQRPIVVVVVIVVVNLIIIVICVPLAVATIRSASFISFIDATLLVFIIDVVHDFSVLDAGMRIAFLIAALIHHVVHIIEYSKELASARPPDGTTEAENATALTIHGGW